MLDRPNVIPFAKLNDCQGEHVDDPVGQAIAALTSAAGNLYQLSMLPDHRDTMVKDLHHIADAALAINLVWSRIKAREEA